MLAKIKSFGLCGLEGYGVDVEVDISAGIPKFTIVGLADTAIKESAERVRTAIKESGFAFESKRYTINLAPADMKKDGSIYDLPIALAILSASGQIDMSRFKDVIIIGELGLDGTVARAKGVLPILISAREKGFKNFIIPFANESEASFIEGINCYAVQSLKEVTQILDGSARPHIVKLKSFEEVSSKKPKCLDFENVKGQKLAKRALEIAAAGGHNVIMIGPPGSGKSMLAKCFAGILPDLTFEEALEVTKIHSIAGVLDYDTGIVCSRPIRTPHHTASSVSLTGGGVHSRPGEISLAHNGVLFLDEFPEYQRGLIETLRQPLEDGSITVARASATVTYPASFTLIASMNPCPCGNFGSHTKECKCTPSQIQKYLSKLSGPIMDRIDIHVEVDSVSYGDLSSTSAEETSAQIKQRVDKARKIQLERFKDEGIYSNSKMNAPQTKKYCHLSVECASLMENAFNKLQLSARAHDRILKVARTIADLDGSEDILPQHIMEAINYRTLDKKYF